MLRAKSLAKALESAIELTELDLSDNSISDSGAILLAEALSSGMASKLEHLHFEGNEITAKGMQKCAELLSLRKDLNIYVEADVEEEEEAKVDAKAQAGKKEAEEDIKKAQT